MDRLAPASTSSSLLVCRAYWEGEGMREREVEKGGKDLGKISWRRSWRSHRISEEVGIDSPHAGSTFPSGAVSCSEHTKCTHTYTSNVGRLRRFIRFIPFHVGKCFFSVAPHAHPCLFFGLENRYRTFKGKGMGTFCPKLFFVSPMPDGTDRPNPNYSPLELVSKANEVGCLHISQFFHFQLRAFLLIFEKEK
jgi:hypothetical protein